MAVPDLHPFSGLTALELSTWRLGNLALLPSLVGLVSPHCASSTSHIGNSGVCLGTSLSIILWSMPCMLMMTNSSLPLS